MNSFVVERDDGAGDVVIETPAGKTTITIQQYQHIYNQITGKSEQLSKNSKKNIKICLSDLSNLDTRIKQTLQQYNMVGFSSKYSAFYTNDQKETSRDFERFSLTAKAPACQTDSLNFVYNFSIKLPQISEAQNYAVSIRIINKWALRKKLIEELPSNAPRRIINLFSSETVEIKIDYVDYTVARNIIAMLDDWLDGLAGEKSSGVLIAVQKRSHLIPIFTKYTTMFLLVIGLLQYSQTLFSEIDTFHEFGQVLGASAFLAYIFISAGKAIGKYIENSIDSIDNVSYIKLTRGDENAAIEAEKEKKHEITKAAIGGVISAIFGIATKYSAKLIGFIG